MNIVSFQFTTVFFIFVNFKLCFDYAMYYDYKKIKFSFHNNEIIRHETILIS